jgi:hypothetical protein
MVMRRLAAAVLLVSLAACSKSSKPAAPSAAGDGVPVPEISSVTPGLSPPGGGGRVLLKGFGFKPGATVRVGANLAADVAVADDQTLSFKMPAGPSGGSDIVVTNPDGGHRTFTQGVVYQPSSASPPGVSRVTPRNGPKQGGSLVSLEGSGFEPESLVFVGGAPASVEGATGTTQLTIRTPIHGGDGTADVVVTNHDGESGELPGAFAFAEPPPNTAPRIRGVAPTEGPVAGGNPVALVVDLLDSSAQLFVAGRPVPFTRTAGGLTVVMPSVASHGSVDLVVTNPDGQSSRLAGGYVYVNGTSVSAPSISRVTPSRAPPAGGGTVVIAGSGFQPNAQVLFGNAPAAQVVVASATTLSCQVPPGSVGSADVTVQNPDGGIVRATAAFAFAASGAPAPTLGAITPSTGLAAGGTVAELSGAGFTDGAIVVVGGHPAGPATRVDGGTLTARLSDGDPGGSDVTITNPDGQSATLHGAFTRAALSAAAPPRISALSPAAGALDGGFVVTISSLAFDFAPGALVFIGGHPAAASPLAGSLVVVVPPGTRTGPVDVAVTNPDGQSDVLADGLDYYVPAPLLASLTPACGPAGGGTDVILSGRGFRAGAGATVGGVPLSGLTRIDSATLRGTTGASRPGSGDAMVVNLDGQADTRSGGFTFTDATHPCPGVTQVDLSLARVIPTSGPITGGDVVTVIGNGFTGVPTVTVGGVAATDVRLLGSGALTFTLPPAGATGRTDLVVRLADGRQKSLPGSFTYYDPASLQPAPTISAVSPGASPNTGGGVVTVSGSGLLASTRVFFGTVEATFPSLADTTRLTAVVPASLPGPVDVTVLNPDGRSSTLASGFVYYPAGAAGAPPLAARVEPRTGSTAGPTTVVVRGSGFQAGAQVFTAGVPADAVSLQPDGSLAATIRPQPAGTVDVTVTNPDGQASVISLGFTFSPPVPTLLALTPARGPLAGGTTTLVTGTGFLPGDVVTIGGAAAAVKFLDQAALFVTVPANAAGLADLGLVRGGVTVATLPAAFTYDPGFAASPAPTVVALAPATGPASGGTILWLTGSGLRADSQVFFGARPATRVQLADANHAVVQAPAGATTGAVDVTILNGDGQAGAQLRAFTYVSDVLLLGLAPRLASVTPATGPESSASRVLLTGSNFAGTELVFVGTGRGAGVQAYSSSVLQATFPLQPAATVDVAVTRLDGRSARLANGFTYLARPTLLSAVNTATSIAGATGPSAGGTPATVVGSGFQAGATLTFGGYPATQVLVLGPTLLSCLTPKVPAGPADLLLTNPDGQQAVLAAGWLFVDPPAVASVRPPQGPLTGGTWAVVNGNGFVPGTSVSVGSTPAITTYGSPTSLVVQVPAGSLAGVAALTVHNPDNQSVTVPAGFTYTTGPLGPPPTLSAVWPPTGPTTGGSMVQLTGTGLLQGAIGIVGGQALARGLVVSGTTLTGLTGAATIGAAAVAVTNPDGQSAVLPAGFSYVDAATLGPPPLVDHLFPGQALAPGGTAVAVLGLGFSTGGAARVYLQGYPAPAASGSTDKQLNVITPAAQAGAADVAVVNIDGQTSIKANAFTFLVPPPIFDGLTPLCVVSGTSCTTPARGPTTGGTTVQINGSYFQPPVQVFFGTVLGAVVSATPTLIVATAPPNVAGSVGVRIVNQDGQSAPPLGAANPPQFQYQPPPVLTQVQPTSGSPGGGDLITLRGQYFSGDATTMRVKFGNAPAAIQGPPTSTVLQVLSPSATAAGQTAVAVQITNDDGQSTTVPGAFIYLPPPAPPIVTGVTPNAGQQRGTNTVTVLGQHFQFGASVAFGNVLAPNVSVTSDSALSCVVPAASATGTVDLKVTNPDGLAATLANAYTYTPGPAPSVLGLFSVTPSSGATTGGTAIVIAGTGFQPGATATLLPKNGLACAGSLCALLNLQVLGPTAMLAVVPPQPVAGAAGYDLQVQNPGGASALLASAWSYGNGIQRFTPYGLRLPMESHAGKIDRGSDAGTLNGMYMPGWWGTVGDFTVSQAGLADVFLGSNGGRAPRLYQGQYEPAMGPLGKPRVFRDFSSYSLRNTDGSPVRDNCCGSSSPYTYQTFLPRTLDVDGDGQDDVVFWNDVYGRNGFVVFRNIGGALAVVFDGGNPWGAGQTATDWVGGYTTSPRQMVDFNLDGAPDFLAVGNNVPPLLMLSCGGTSTDPITLLRIPKPAATSCVTAGASPLITVAVPAGPATITSAQVSGFLSTAFSSFMTPGAQRWLVDNGPSAEFVTISAATANSFTATFRNAHAVNTPMVPVIETMAHAAAAIAANSTVTLTLDSIQGFALTDFWLLAEPGSATEERVRLTNPAVNYLAGTVSVHFANAHPKDLLLTVRNPSGFAYDATRFNASGAANTVVAGDLDGDGDIDVITGNQIEGLKVFLNNAANLVIQGKDPVGFSMTTSAPITAATFPGGITGGNVRALSLLDANGDGLPDLLVGYRDNQQERLFMNRGGGQFVDEATVIPLTSPTCLNGNTWRLPTVNLPLKDSVVRYDVRDFDGNGALDVLAWIQVNATSGTYQKPLRLWLNDGKGCFYGSPTDYTTGGLADTLFNPAQGILQTWLYALGDFNKDGLPDMLAGFEGVQTREYVNLGGTFADKTASNLPDATVPASTNAWWKYTTGALLVDLNGDGFLDLVASQTNRDPGQGPCSYQPCTGDPDGGIVAFKNDQQGSFPSDSTLTTFPTAVLPGSSPPKIVSALPIVSSAMDASPLYPGGPLAIIIASNTRYSTPRPAVLQGTPFDNPVGAHRLLLSNLNGTFSDITYPHLPTGGQIFTTASSIRFVDLDNDGFMDIVVGDAANGSIMIWKGTPDGFFIDVTSTALPSGLPGGGRVWQILPANLDQDNQGLTDLFVVRDANGSRVLINHSDVLNHKILLADETVPAAGQPLQRMPNPPPSAISAVIGDFDCTGGPDIFLLDPAGGEHLYTNNACLVGGNCGFFNDVTALPGVLPPESRGVTCVGTSCGGQVGLLPLQVSSLNTDLLILRTSDGYNNVRPHRLLQNNCGTFTDITRAAWSPMPTDDDWVLTNGVVAGDIFGHALVPGGPPNVRDLVIFDGYGPRVYRAGP